MAESDHSLSTLRFEDYVRHHKREHELIQQAQEAARVANEYRLERLNELRQEVERDRAVFMKEDVYTAHVAGIRKDFVAIDERIRSLEGAMAAAAGSSRAWVIAVGFFFTVLQIVLRFV